MDKTTKAVYEYMKRNRYFIGDFVTDTETGYINSNAAKDLRTQFEYLLYKTTCYKSDEIIIDLVEKALNCVNWREIDEVIQSTE
jgi:hypothetical protein